MIMTIFLQNIHMQHYLQNYNKSRIYSSRGVRLIQIKLDDQVIFHGEIARASGELNGPLTSFGDVSSPSKQVLQVVA